MNHSRLLLPALALAWLSVAPATSLAADPPPAGEAQATESQLAALVDAVEKKYSGVDTIRAEFTQAKADTFGKVTQDGDLVLQRPTRMRWRFTSGDESEFVTDGGTLWIYTKADNQVLRMRDTAQATSTANTFLTSLDSLDELFTIKLVDRSDGPVLDLVPREQGMYKRIRLSLDKDLVLRGVVFTDAYDNVTDLSFRDVELNSKVDPSVFTFEVPEGATVIDN